jgi:hypothetical protein
MRLAAAGLLLAAALAVQAAAPSVAFVADIRGNATIEGDGKLNFLAELPAGTRLLLGSNAVASITYAATGHEFTLTGPGEFLVTPGEVKAEKGTAPRRRTVLSLPDPGVVGRLSQTATASLRMRSVSAAPAEKAGPSYPVETRVTTLTPVLRTRGATPGAAAAIQDAAGKELWTGGVNPEGTRPAVKLSPATRYTWTVMTPQGALAEARFEPLPADAIARVEKSPLAARTFPERVMHAFLLHDLGAGQEAREAWAALARERPDLPELAALAR